jgi:hypothetical protein
VTDKRVAFQALQDRIVNGDGRASADLRARAFEGAGFPPPLDELVTDADFAAARAAGFGDDELFELVICAAVGQSARLYDAGLVALAEALGGQ